MKTVITKSIVVKKRPADWEHLEVSVGYSEEIEYESSEELFERRKSLNKILHNEVKKEIKYCYEKFWNKEV